MIASTAPQASPAAPWRGGASHISVRSPDGPRWRAGRQFGPAPTVLAKADLTPRQAEMVLGDPQLDVVELGDPSTPPAAS